MRKLWIAILLYLPILPACRAPSHSQLVVTTRVSGVQDNTTVESEVKYQFNY